MSNYFVNAQITNLLSGINTGISNLIIYQDYIYFNSYTNNTIYKYPIQGNASQTPEVFKVLPNKPSQLLLDNDILYIATDASPRIYTLKLTESNPALNELTDSSGTMAIFNNELYIGQYVESKIVKINLSTGAKTEYLTGYKPNFFKVDGNFLYFTSNYTNKLYKINLISNNISVLLENLNYVSGLVIKDNICYFCESQTNKISYYNLTSGQFINHITLNSGSWPNGITIYNGDLYFVSTVTGQISMIPLNSLNTETFTKPQIKIFPNPTTEILQIETNESYSNYEILDLNGKSLIKNKFDSKIISVDVLEKGYYILMLDKQAYKFLKN